MSEAVSTPLATTSATITTTAIPITASPRALLTWAISLCSGDGSDTVWSSRSAMAPISVSRPVEVTTPDALDHCRPLVNHLESVTDRGLAGQGVGVLLNSFGLAGQRRLLNPQAVGRDQAAVGADRVAFTKHKKVAPHQIAGGQRHQPAIAEDRGHDGGHACQCGDGALRPALLQKTDQCVCHNDEGDDDDVDGQSRNTLREPGQQRNGHRAKEQVDQRVLKLPQDLPPQWLRRLLWELVRPIGFESSRGIPTRQTVAGIDPEPVGDHRGVGPARIVLGSEGFAHAGSFQRERTVSAQARGSLAGMAAVRGIQTHSKRPTQVAPHHSRRRKDQRARRPSGGQPMSEGVGSPASIPR